MDKFKWDLSDVSVAMIRIGKKMFGNSGGVGITAPFNNMRTLKSKAQLGDKVTVDQMFGGSS